MAKLVYSDCTVDFLTLTRFTSHSLLEISIFHTKFTCNFIISVKHNSFLYDILLDIRDHYTAPTRRTCSEVIELIVFDFRASLINSVFEECFIFPEPKGNNMLKLNYDLSTVTFSHCYTNNSIRNIHCRIVHPQFDFRMIIVINTSDFSHCDYFHIFFSRGKCFNIILQSVISQIVNDFKFHRIEFSQCN